MSLADELLADLEEAAEEEEGGSYGEEEEEPAIEDVQEETQLDLSGDSVKSIAKLWDSKMFAEIMMKIEEYISKQAKASEVMGPVEAAPEYRVIVDANNLTVEIENELSEYWEGQPVKIENELSEHWEGKQKQPCLVSPTASPVPI